MIEGQPRHDAIGLADLRCRSHDRRDWRAAHDGSRRPRGESGCCRSNIADRRCRRARRRAAWRRARRNVRNAAQSCAVQPSTPAAASATSANSPGGDRTTRGVAARQLGADLLDIRVPPAERGRQRQRRRQRAGIDRAEEQAGEFGRRLGDQRDAVSRADAGRISRAASPRASRAARQTDRRGRDCARASKKLSPRLPLRSVVERLAKGREVGDPARQGVEGRRRPLLRYRRDHRVKQPHPPCAQRQLIQRQTAQSARQRLSLARRSNSDASVAGTWR